MALWDFQSFRIRLAKVLNLSFEPAKRLFDLLGITSGWKWTLTYDKAI